MGSNTSPSAASGALVAKNDMLQLLLRKGARVLKLRMTLSVATVLLLLSTLSWAGSSYANITVLGTDSESVVEAIKDMGLVAIVVSGKADGAVICEKTIDSQDDVYGRNLARKFSKSLKCIAVYMLNIDGAELLITTYAYGDQVFDYDSSPGHFKGVDRPPSIQGLENIENTFPNADTAKLQTALEAGHVSVDDRHMQIWNLLSLPFNTSGLGYRNLMDKKSRSQLEQQFGFQFVEID
jgi:hypothetical protein